MGKNKYSEEALEIVKNFILLDDDFMNVVFADKDCVELILRIITDKPDLKVLQSGTEYVISNLMGRGVRLDVKATDSCGKIYNIEVQRSDAGAISRCARYNSSLIDAHAASPGDKYETLPETYVIFITENDVLGRSLPIYHIERVILETGDLFNDKAHIIYVNSQITGDTDLGRLMHDFRCKQAIDMYYPILANRVAALKETDEGVDSMCEAVEKYARKSREEGREEGLFSSLKALIAKTDMSLDKAMDILDIPKSDYDKYTQMLKRKGD